MVTERLGAPLPLQVRTKGNAFRAAFASAGAADYPNLESRLAGILHPSERRYFCSLPAERRKVTYLLGRYAAKQALSLLLGEPDCSRIEIASGVLDQPVVRYPASEPFDVSISHTDAVACAIAFPALLPMAIDIEQIDRRRSEVMKTQILPYELDEAVRRGTAEESAPALVWTAKEALSKVLRCGLTCPFDLLAIDRIESGGRPSTGTFRHFGQYKFHSWIRGEVVATIVLPGVTVLETDLFRWLPGIEDL